MASPTAKMAMDTTARVKLGKVPIMNQQAVASAKPRIIAASGDSFLVSAAAGTVTMMMVQASTVSISSNSSNCKTSRA